MRPRERQGGERQGEERQGKLQGWEGWQGQRERQRQGGRRRRGGAGTGTGTDAGSATGASSGRATETAWWWGSAWDGGSGSVCRGVASANWSGRVWSSEPAPPMDPSWGWECPDRGPVPGWARWERAKRHPVLLRATAPRRPRRCSAHRGSRRRDGGPERMRPSDRQRPSPSHPRPRWPPRPPGSWPSRIGARPPAAARGTGVGRRARRAPCATAAWAARCSGTPARSSRSTARPRSRPVRAGPPDRHGLLV